MSSRFVPFDDQFRQDRFSFNYLEGTKKFGPWAVEEQSDSLDKYQQAAMRHQLGIQPVIRYRTSWVLGLGPGARDNAGMFWLLSRRPSRPIDISRLHDEVRVLD